MTSKKKYSVGYHTKSPGNVTATTSHNVTRSAELENAIKEFNLNSSSVALLDLCNITTDAEGLQTELIQLLRTEEFAGVAPADGERDAIDINEAFAARARERVLEQFSGEHSLSEACLSFLQLLSIEVLADVLTSFSPGDEDFNVALMNYAAEKKASGFKDVDQKGGSPKDQIFAPEVLAFTRQWNLNDISIKLLQSLPPDVVNDVMLNFHPRDVSRDVNPVFGSFVKSRLFPRPTYHPTSDSFAEVSTSKATKQFLRTHGAYGEPAFPPSPPVQFSWPWEYNNPWNNAYTIESFVRRWNLNESAVHLLNSLSPEVFYDVISYFNPKDTTRDVNAIFQAFARSRANASYAPPEPMYYNIPTPQLSGVFGMQPSIGLPPYSDFDLFTSYWGLNSSASKLLKGLPFDQQFEIMQNFSPKDVSRDVNPVFLAFAKSRVAQRGIRKGGGF